MAERPEQPGQATESVAIEPIRILLPSPIGALGIELLGERIGGIVIVPKGRERRTYKPFASLKRAERTDFIDEVLGRFSEYLAGARRKLELDYDLRAMGLSGFHRRVLRQTARIPYGRTRTYQQIADSAGRPDGYRQVLSTLMTNPLPLVVPCHRVVTHKSGVGSFIGGPKKKQWLLKMERRGLTVG
jgi:methylated-DNA-[protein]-cysteine S-methyltransferase